MKCYNVFMPIRGHIAILLTAVAFSATPSNCVDAVIDGDGD